jgi:hypothetical protein
MKALALLSVFLALPILLPAQTAQVIQLSSTDSDTAQSLYAEKASVEKQIASLEQKIKKSYLTPAVTGGYSFCVNKYCTSTRGYWDNGFEYSSDFKFIVPKPAPPTPTYTIQSCPYSYCWANPYIFYNGTWYVAPMGWGESLTGTISIH